MQRVVSRRVASLGITDRRTAPRSPWQNPSAERHAEQSAGWHGDVNRVETVEELRVERSALDTTEQIDGC